MKPNERFKEFKSEVLDLNEGSVLTFDRKNGYFTIVSEGIVYRVPINCSWFMKMETNMPYNNDFFNPKGVIV